MNMKMNISTEKLLISFKVITIFSSKILNDVQDLASLKTLSNLIALSAEMAPPPPIWIPAISIMISTIEITTIVQSKILKLSLA